MQSDIDLYHAAIRYVGKPVIVQSYSHQKYAGILTLCHCDFIALTNCVLMSELDSSNWQDQILLSNIEDNVSSGTEETLIRMHNVLSISCDDRELAPLPEPEAPMVGDPPIGSHHRFELCIGTKLIPLIEQADRQFFRQVRSLRSDLKSEIGFQIEPIHIQSRLDLEANQYAFSLDGTTIASGHVFPDRHLAISPCDGLPPVNGDPTKDPAFGLDAIWLDACDPRAAEKEGYTVVDAITVIITHLSEVIRQYRQDFLTYDLVCLSLSALETEANALAGDFYLQQTARKTLFQVLKNLLGERAWIGCFSKIAEAVAIHYQPTLSVDDLTDRIRPEIGRHLLRDCMVDKNQFRAILLDTELEYLLNQSLPALSPQQLAAIVDLFKQATEDAALQNKNVAILTGDKRRELYNSVRRSLPKVTMIAYSEVPIEMTVHPQSVIEKAAFDAHIQAQQATQKEPDEIDDSESL